MFVGSRFYVFELEMTYQSNMDAMYPPVNNLCKSIKHLQICEANMFGAYKDKKKIDMIHLIPISINSILLCTYKYNIEDKPKTKFSNLFHKGCSIICLYIRGFEFILLQTHKNKAPKVFKDTKIHKTLYDNSV
jgi:hypothetical protein